MNRNGAHTAWMRMGEERRRRRSGNERKRERERKMEMDGRRTEERSVCDRHRHRV